MIRTAAALFAKKTAIVAISGVVVIGGAGLALANTDVIDPPAEDELCYDADGVVVDCPVEPGEGTEEEGGEGDGLEEEGTGEDGAEDEEGVEEEGVEEEGVEEEDGLEEDGDVTTTEGEDGEELVEDGEDEARPDNHGAAVSQAAKDCHGMIGEGEGQYRNHGQCVRATANKNAAPEEPPAEEPPAEEPAEEQVVEEQVVEEAPEEEPAPAAATSPAPKGKPAHAGPPAGKGGGKK